MLTSGSRCLPENLPKISKSADLGRVAPGSTGVAVTLYVLSVYQDPIGTFLERSAEFEIRELDCKINVK